MSAKTPTNSKHNGRGAPKPEPPTDWNIMIYMNGDSGLSGNMISQLKELTDAGFQRSTRVLAYFDPNTNGKDPRIFDVNSKRKKKMRKETMIGDGENPFVRDIAEDCHIPALPQLPSAIALRYFLTYARTFRPAKNYMLFIIGHGVIVGNDTFLPDTVDNSAITLADLGWILKEFAGKVENKSKFHLLGFHSCSMSSVEVVHELADTADHMMATQGTAFPGSWPYRQLLKKIFGAIKDSRTNGRRNGLVKRLLKSLQDLTFYNGEDFELAGYSSDLSICSLDKTRVDGLKKPLQQLSRALQDGLPDRDTQDYIQLAHLKSQSFWGENYTDLFDFCNCLRKQCKPTNKNRIAIRRACKKVMDTLKKGEGNLVEQADYYGPSSQYAYGLSIYFPWRAPEFEVVQRYQGYSFTTDYKPETCNGGSKKQRDDSWWSFLEKYFDKTQRDLRDAQSRRRRDKQPEEVNVEWPGTDWLKALEDDEVLGLIFPAKTNELLGRAYERSWRAKYGLPTVKDAHGGNGLAPPDKPSGPLAPPDKPSGPLAPPDKPSGPLGVSGNGHGTIAIGKTGLGPPDKSSGVMAGPPDKVGVGLGAYTVIKNFMDPRNEFVTSRRKKFSAVK